MKPWVRRCGDCGQLAVECECATGAQSDALTRDRVERKMLQVQFGFFARTVEEIRRLPETGEQR